MNAEKMFNELGYQKVDFTFQVTSLPILTYMQFGNFCDIEDDEDIKICDVICIDFEQMLTKGVCKSLFTCYVKKVGVDLLEVLRDEKHKPSLRKLPQSIKIDEWQAINKQLEELSWIKENTDE